MRELFKKKVFEYLEKNSMSSMTDMYRNIPHQYRSKKSFAESICLMVDSGELRRITTGYYDLPEPKLIDPKDRPVLGIMPEWLWIEKRRDGLRETIGRFLNCGKPVNSEWVDEYNKLCQFLIERRAKQ